MDRTRPIHYVMPAQQGCAACPRSHVHVTCPCRMSMSMCRARKRGGGGRMTDSVRALCWSVYASDHLALISASGISRGAWAACASWRVTRARRGAPRALRGGAGGAKGRPALDLGVGLCLEARLVGGALGGGRRPWRWCAGRRRDARWPPCRGSFFSLPCGPPPPSRGAAPPPPPSRCLPTTNALAPSARALTTVARSAFASSRSLGGEGAGDADYGGRTPLARLCHGRQAHVLAASRRAALPACRAAAARSVR